MEFAYSPKVNELCRRVGDFMDAHIVPRMRQWHEEVHQGIYPVSFMEDLKALARAEGLWNLFLPGLRQQCCLA